jgi:hypothetical protein
MKNKMTTIEKAIAVTQIIIVLITITLLAVFVAFAVWAINEFVL